MLDLDRLKAAYEKANADLLAERTPDGHWVGELSSSALSTATAVTVLAMSRCRVGQGRCGRRPTTRSGRAYVADSLVPPYELATSSTAASATSPPSKTPTAGSATPTCRTPTSRRRTWSWRRCIWRGWPMNMPRLLERADAYLESKGRLAGLRERYGIDKTFVVPIMTNLALAGLVDWREIDPLPFELACVPQSWYRFVGMPVVSYAIPALVAIGQARYFHAPPWNPVSRLVRWLSISRSLKVLRRMQPDSGGYLEATPLTSFVVMSLAA